MSEGHGRDEWGRMSVLCALIANAHRTAKGRAFRPADFDPFSDERENADAVEITSENIDEMKHAFLKK